MVKKHKSWKSVVYLSRAFLRILNNAQKLNFSNWFSSIQLVFHFIETNIFIFSNELFELLYNRILHVLVHTERHFSIYVHISTKIEKYRMSLLLKIRFGAWRTSRVWIILFGVFSRKYILRLKMPQTLTSRPTEPIFNAESWVKVVFDISQNPLVKLGPAFYFCCQKTCSI